MQLWSAILILTALDALMLLCFADFVRQIGAGGHCGTWAISIDIAMKFLGAISLPVGIGLLWTYQVHRDTLSPASRFMARLPLCCLGAMLLTYFAVFPVVLR